MILSGKTALITGAARGIGAAFAKRYVEEGAKVVIADIDIDRAEKLATKINAYSVYLDISKQQSIEDAVNATIKKIGTIDILVNNAAIFHLAPIKDIAREDYQKVFDINVAGTLFTLQAVAKHMIKSNIKGKIINMASQAGRRGEALVGVYCASKAAIISITQSAGLDLIQHKINVNAIAPGVVDGEHWDNVDLQFAKYEGYEPGYKKQQVAREVPFGRMGNAKDLEGMAVFLASDQADYIVGQTYNVDGGNCLN